MFFTSCSRLLSHPMPISNTRDLNREQRLWLHHIYGQRSLVMPTRIPRQIDQSMLNFVGRLCLRHDACIKIFTLTTTYLFQTCGPARSKDRRLEACIQLSSVFTPLVYCLLSPASAFQDCRYQTMPRRVSAASEQPRGNQVRPYFKRSQFPRLHSLCFLLHCILPTRLSLDPDQAVVRIHCCLLTLHDTFGEALTHLLRDMNTSCV
jgi:hypothetical protein